MELESSGETFVLAVSHPRHPPAEDAKIELVLSPPAAARLSRLLQEAVDDYLYGEEKE